MEELTTPRKMGCNSQPDFRFPPRSPSPPVPMKPSLLAGVLLAPLSASAVTVVSNTTTSSITVNATTRSNNPDPLDIGNVSASAGSTALAVSALGVNGWEFSGSGATFAALHAEKSSSGGTTTTFTGNATYTVAFTVGALENAQVSFNLSYLLAAAESAQITWSFSGPQALPTIAGNITTNGTTSIAQQTATIVTPGTYTFTLTGAIANNGTITNGNNQNLATLNFTNIDLRVVDILGVPEPSVFLFGGLGLLALARRRR